MKKNRQNIWQYIKKSYLCIRNQEITLESKCPDGGIGRRAGLKHQWIHFHPGSTPGLGTKKEKVLELQFCPDGGIGRRAGLKHQWIHFHPGSTPGLGTKKGEGFQNFLLFLCASQKVLFHFRRTCFLLRITAAFISGFKKQPPSLLHERHTS